MVVGDSDEESRILANASPRRPVRVACGRDNFDTKRRRPPRTGRDDGPAVDPNGPNSDRTDAACACDRAADDSCNLRPIVVDGLIDAVTTGEYNELRVGLWLLFGHYWRARQRFPSDNRSSR